MKRFEAIVTSLLIIFVFVALNYLLLDRESLVNLRESNQASIDAISRINMNLSEEKSKLLEQNEILVTKVAELETKVETLEERIDEQQNKINEQTEFILAMKMHINPLPLKKAAIEWVNLLSENQLGTAFMKSEESCKYWKNEWNLRAFTGYFEQNVESIKLILTGDEQQPVVEVMPSSSADWYVNVEVHVEVKLKENAREDNLKNGGNILKLTYNYNERTEQWLISEVSSEVAEAEEQKPETETTAEKESD
ncbi:MAG: hypothetical protein GX045_09355 [Clostridiaceae bacterium]|nr:hypothetical protein [Clostridiaceae bacterium]